MKITNKIKMQETIYSIFFIFIIINSMIPNSNNIHLLYPLQTIIPGIEDIYTKDSNDNVNKYSTDTHFSLKIIETFKKYVIH